MKFPKQLQAHRHRLKHTQAQTAQVLDIGLRTYAGWERGDDPRRVPHVLTCEGALARLAKIPSPHTSQ